MSDARPREFVFDNHMQQVANKPTKRKSESQRAEERLAQQYGVCAAHKRQKKKVRIPCPIIICHQLIRLLECLCNVPEEEVALLRRPQLTVTKDVADTADGLLPGGGLPECISDELSNLQSGFPVRISRFETDAVIASSVSCETTSLAGPQRLPTNFVERCSPRPLWNDFPLTAPLIRPDNLNLEARWSFIDAVDEFLECHKDLLEVNNQLRTTMSYYLIRQLRAAVTFDEILPSKLSQNPCRVEKEAYQLL